LNRRSYSAWALATALILSSCGYIGGPAPPLINIPATVTNLAAVQRDGKLVVQFTIPTMTTEGQPLKPPVVLELRLGDQHPSPKAIQNGIALYEIPSTDWVGRDARIEVRAVGANGKPSAWSAVTVPVVAAPAVPQDVRAQSAATGIRVTWQSAGSHFRMLRGDGGSGNAAYAVVAPDVQAHEWIDTTAEFDKAYRYLVQTIVPLAGGRWAESDLPEAVTGTREAPLPGAPTGLRAVAGVASIELSWDVPEGTPAVSFRIYRATGNGEFARIGESQGVPTYSDKTAAPGVIYRYEVSPVDAAGREGSKSAAVEASR